MITREWNKKEQVWDIFRDDRVILKVEGMYYVAKRIVRKLRRL